MTFLMGPAGKNREQEKEFDARKKNLMAFGEGPMGMMSCRVVEVEAIVDRPLIRFDFGQLKQ